MGHNQKRKWALLLHSNGDMWHSLNKIIIKEEKAFFKTKKQLSLSSLSPTFSEALSPSPSRCFPSPSFSIEAPNKAPTFGHHFCSKLRKEGIFGVVKRVSTCGTSKFQIVMAAQLIHDRVEMECLEGAWETLEGNARF
ncbi:hypothetical protein GmHk_16G046126 [Glycine max]|nr:hypothetical protein GmHk_16G046126 [Glycine max]